ncbi:methionyl-tRNA formyltransferase [Halochromatium glycolicum]|uniref:Methionyl-tRNA formyltransferase n=1 Tax=Halochromatium glycolicum TaxID=85075 RepID=A0AAJ0U1G6_9GAMM|nr:methionyl-tRNA formyltransferase [Halochromatium glycolicum]MBK1703120.1 methionyl-tRNA formyltransferase [Halochromatium glycolicum]
MAATRILFAGTPDFAVPALSALIAAEWSVVGVYTQPDRPAGRGRKTVPGPVKQVALDAGLPVFQPPSLKNPATIEQLRGLNADIMIVAAYGLILPPAALASPRLGCINIHASLLPHWRGAAPIQRALLAGDEATGISLMQMEAGLDTGPVYATQRTRIAPRETGGSLHDRLAAIGAKLLLDKLPEIMAGQLTPAPQDAGQATYAAKLEKDEAPIDWSQSAEVIDRRIRAFNPWPVAQTRWGGETLRIWEAVPLEGDDTHNSPPGSILRSGPDGIDVATGAGVLRITRLQAPGKRKIAAADFAHSRRLDGTVFG